ncbi:aryl sulfotransferase [Halobellus salinus]|uniref:aryl sulfotransferase n=1 Tax=Halobellus salinus TaxID=931585 RepID=UPI0016649F01|nr:aryl sulfotransferase [Halobellus salinus]
MVVIPLVVTAATNPVLVSGESRYSTDGGGSVSGLTAITGTELVVVEGEGTIDYRDTRRDEYWDVDPVPNTSAVVVSTVVKNPDRLDCSDCTVQRIERIDVATGDRRVLYTEVTPGTRNVEWHDVDRINRTHHLIADMSQHEVEMVDVSTGTTDWEWSAYTALSPGSGGAFDGDWTHLNDVEIVRNGQYVAASLRNHDTVVFINRTSGSVNETISLGEDDDHSILYEQHNPDHIPADRGGPAMIVADSNNDRIVEYQRSDGEWVESWVWQDDQLKWPRDADRLPNGHTLITDTNNNRVLEVDARGRVQWSIFTPINVYDAERLSTPAESGGGVTAAAADLESRTVRPETAPERLQAGVEATLGPRAVNGILWVTPSWMRLPEFATVLLSLLSALALAGYEASVRGLLSGR